MKTNLSFMCAAVIALAACNNNSSTTAESDSLATETPVANTRYEVRSGNYVDLSTGREVYVVPDPETGYAMDSISRTPIEFYINTQNNDTIYKTGAVVNSSIVRTDGKWSLTEDAKTKMEGDEYKYKDGDYKVKVDGDETKIKDGETKTEIEDGEVETKVDD
jgi:hypothetical protein